MSEAEAETIKRPVPYPGTEGAPTGDPQDMSHMVHIKTLIADMQSILDRFGNTCVYIRRGGLSWGAVALNRRAEDEKFGLFDLQSQHDRAMQQRVEQVERLIADKNHWMVKEHEARQRLQELEKLVYVPGVWKCAKCGCVVISTNLHADSGAMSANNEPQTCPNNCGPMWRRTERDAGNELCDRLDAAADKINTLLPACRTARDFIAEVRDDLLRSVCLIDKTTDQPDRASMDPGDAEHVAAIEAVLAGIDQALGVETGQP